MCVCIVCMVFSVLLVRLLVLVMWFWLLCVIVCSLCVLMMIGSIVSGMLSSDYVVSFGLVMNSMVRLLIMVMLLCRVIDMVELIMLCSSLLLVVRCEISLLLWLWLWNLVLSWIRCVYR